MTSPVVQAFTSRSGLPSAKVGGVAIHSPYDPEKEADRFIEASPSLENASAVVILGAGLGYVERALESRFPRCRIIAVCYSEEIYRLRPEDVLDAWHPGSREMLGAYLRRVIGDLEVEGMRILEWPPSAQIFPAESRRANLAVQRAVAEASGSLTTTAVFGRLWMRNTLFNFLSLDALRDGDLCSPASPVLVAAPGPGLEDVLPCMKRARASFDLWALPGCLMALEHAGLEPDLVVMTDPGYWSAVHTHFSRLGCPIAMPLSATRGMRRFQGGIVPLAQPLFFETELLSRAGVEARSTPPHGTVTATALELALSATRGPVIAAGVDLCERDILSHARPNAFDRLLLLHSGRLAPHYSASFQRACASTHRRITGPRGTVRVGTALKTYAGWLSEMEKGRIRRLSPSPVPLDSMTPMTEEELLSLPARRTRGTSLHPIPSYPSPESRRRIVSRLISDWEEALDDGLSKLEESGTPAVLSPRTLTIAYYTEAFLLFEARRKLRLGDAAGARGSAREMLGRSRAFLALIRGKAGL